MSAGASSHSRTHSAEWQVEIVMHKNQVLAPQGHLVSKLLDGRTASIHANLQFDQAQLGLLPHGSRDTCVTVFHPCHSELAAERVQYLVADVVRCVQVTRPRIAKTDDHRAFTFTG